MPAVKTFVPKFLPRADLDWRRLVPHLGRAARALAHYDGILHGLPDPAVLLSPLTTQEAVLSSKIEGTQATLSDVLRFEAGEPARSAERGEDIREIIAGLERAYEVFVRNRVKFRVGSIVFVAMSRDEQMMGFGFPKYERAGLVASEPDKFLLPRESDMRYNWVVVRLHAIDKQELRELVEEAWAMCVPKKISTPYFGLRRAIFRPPCECGHTGVLVEPPARCVATERHHRGDCRSHRTDRRVVATVDPQSVCQRRHRQIRLRNSK